MQSYAIKLKNALLGLSFYIFLHILQSYNFPHAATPPSTTPTNAKIPAQRFLFESPSREQHIFKYRELNFI